MKRAGLRPSAVPLLLAAGLAVAGTDPDLIAGDIAQVAIPAFALGMTLHRDDSEGTKQWLESTAATVAATQIIKYGTADTAWGTRPNGGPRSFPSGHTSSACAGAFFIAYRYGWDYAWPAMGLATVTGYSRVDERMHHNRDVLAGCALAWGINRYLVTARDAPVSVTPIIDGDEFGLTFEYRY